MNNLLPYALGVVTDMFAAYKVVPFGLVEDDFVNYALSQFGRRYERIEKARGASAEELNRITQVALDEEEG
ncbi:MAG: hypothetical protein ACUVR4_06980 [Anaerolineae bacterium]